MALLVADPIERPRTLFGDGEEDGGVVGGGHTLDEAIVGAWEGLVAHLAVACPLCGGTMRPPSGRCEGCGTTLS
ncbi:MAG: hypothetical protein WAQ33_12045 [Gaiellaceae bacterium]